jgi:hypothetical protein
MTARVVIFTLLSFNITATVATFIPTHTGITLVMIKCIPVLITTFVLPFSGINRDMTKHTMISMPILTSVMAQGMIKNMAALDAPFTNR